MIEDIDKKELPLDPVAIAKATSAHGGTPAWTEEEEKRLVRKIDKRLLPIMAFSYGLQYYDKAMLSQAVNIRQTSIIAFTTNCAVGYLWTP